MAPAQTSIAFFPTLGNHDWYTNDAQPYLDYFTLPGNERYYDFVWGPVHFFALDSDEHEPDGVNAGSAQAAWLQQGLAASTSPWNIVYTHYPPYSSGMPRFHRLDAVAVCCLGCRRAAGGSRPSL